jgi:hypothetical protein
VMLSSSLSATCAKPRAAEPMPGQLNTGARLKPAKATAKVAAGNCAPAASNRAAAAHHRSPGSTPPAPAAEPARPNDQHLLHLVEPGLLNWRRIGSQLEIGDQLEIGSQLET